MLAFAAAALTDLGDSIITLPLAVLVLIWLTAWSNRRTALAWLGALILCGGITAVLKIYFTACPISAISLDSPSGHTSMTTFVYGGLALLTATQLPKVARFAVAALGVAFIVAMAVSRAALHFHSTSEAIFGIVIGGGALALFWREARGLDGASRPLWPLWLAVLVPIVVFSGHSASVEGLLHRIAIHLHAAVNFCV